jgi:hypothetical protein
MLKEILLFAQLIFPSPDDPRVQIAFNQMTTDYATCHAYYDFKAGWHTIESPLLASSALGGMASAGYEGKRVEALANLPAGTFAARRNAMYKDMHATIERAGFTSLYSAYDGFCEDLREDPGTAFLKRLPPKPKEMKPLK